MKKRIFSLLLALVMVLGLLPTAAWAAEIPETPLGEEAVAAPATEEAPDAPVMAQTLAADDATTQWLGNYPLWVGSTKVTVDNADNILGDNTASFAVEDGVPVLTLNGVTITEGTNEHYVAAGGAVGICSHASLTIRLAQGTNNTVNVEGTSRSYGILAYQGSLTITGKGTLTAGAHMTTGTSNCTGINAGGADLTIEGGAAVTALGDTGAQAAAHLTVKDGATLTAGGTRYAVEVGTGFVLPEDYAVLGGASADALQVARTGEMPYSDYYIFVGEENTEDNVAKYAVIVQHPITQQPAKGNGYTVIAPDAGGYQWYTAKEIAKTVVGGTNEDTDTTAAVGTQWGEYSENNQRWSADEYGDYFEIALAGGDKLTVTFPDGDMPTSGGLYLTEVGGRGNSWSHFFGTPSSDSFTVTDTAITCAIPAGVNGIFTLSISGLSNNADPPAIQATRARLEPVQAVDGQTTATLTTTQSGTYLCQVSWPDDFTLDSDPVDYLAPSHSHPVCGAECDHEGEDAHEAVSFAKALTGDDDGKLYIDGTEAALDAEASLKYVLPAGNYYLDGDIALGKPITTLEGETVNLCFNGHTITYANDEDNRSGVFTAEGIFNACDCQGGGGITDARTFPDGNLRFLMYVRSTCALYGGEYIGADGSAYGGETIYSRGRLTVDGATITGSSYAILQENYSTMTIKSGTVTGPVSVNSTRTNFVMEGGTIVNEGGGALSAGGGTIRGGTVQGKLGLLVERATQPVILSGKPTVKGSESDIYFPYPGTNSALLQVSDDLEGVYTLSGSASAITADAPFTFTTPADKDYSAHFVPADSSQGIRDVVDEATGKHTLQLYKVHSHPICGNRCTHQGAHTAVAWTNWDKADSLPTTAGNYVLTGDVTLSNVWTVPTGTTNLCLNGHTVTHGSSGTNTSAIIVPEGAALNLCDCNPTGGTIDGDNKNCTISVTGELSLYGGTLDGKGRVVGIGEGGVFRMHGGSVKGASNATGVLVEENGTFLMDGGTITGNLMGVHVYADGVFRAEGNVVIDGNGGDGDASNVVMHSKSDYTDGGQLTVIPVPMELSGPLGANAKIGLSLYVWENMEEVSPYLALQGYNGYTVTADDFARLSSDKAEDYPLKLTNSKVYFTTPQAHSHTWATAWSGDANGHWHACTAEGCDITDYAGCGETGAAYGAHVYTNDQDITCNTCGYTRSVALYGTVSITGTAKIGGTLTASVSGAPSGVTLAYQWTIEGGDGTVLGTASAFTPSAAAVVGKNLVCTVTTGDAHYTGSIRATTGAVALGDRTAPTGLFTVTDVPVGETTGSIAVSADADKLEYRPVTDPATEIWKAVATTGVTATLSQLTGGSYEFRYKATDTHNASPATTVQVRVLTSQAKALTIASGIEHGTVTKRRDVVNPGDPVTLAVQPDAGYELASITVHYTEGGVEKTITPTVKADNPAQYTFTMPDAAVSVTATFTAVTPPDAGDVTGEVEVSGEDTPAVDVDQEALKDLAGEVSDGDTVTVKLTVEKQDSPTDKDALEAIISGKKDDVLYLDLSLVKQVNDAAPEAITDTGEKVLEIAVPYDFTGKKDVTVYRKHGSEPAQALTKADTKVDGTFRLEGAGTSGKVYVYASKFSTYAIGYTAEATTPVTPSRLGTSGSGYRWPFVDVKRTDSCYQAVKYVYDNKLMEGTSATTFDPEGQLTRAMLAAVLYRAAGSPKVEGAPEFEDTQADAWYSDAVVWAAETRVLRGYGNGKFGPEDPVSKEMLNLVIARQQGEDPAWVGDPALAVPATRAEVAVMLAGFAALLK